jgi:hypothetical protein
MLGGFMMRLNCLNEIIAHEEDGKLELFNEQLFFKFKDVKFYGTNKPLYHQRLMQLLNR